MTNRLLRIFYFLITTLIVVGPALYNRYPLVYFDSGAYMEMSVSLEPSFHRAIGYPLLMRLTGWTISNWPILIVQGALVSLLLFRLSTLLVPRDRWRMHFLSVIVLSFGSSMSWYASQLMPDIFSFILCLIVLLLALEQKLSWRAAIIYGVLLIVSCLTHLSHIPLLLLIGLLLAIFQWRWPQTICLPRINWGILAASIVASWFFVSSYNAIFHMGFGMSSASSVFVTANIGEMGLLKQYLDENCPNSAPCLCEIKDDLPLETGGYLWDANGPVQSHEGGWSGANEEMEPIVRDFLFKPRYLKWFLFGSMKAAVKQMFQIESGSGLQYQYGHGSPPYWPMETHFRQELNEYLGSVQNKKDELPLSFFRKVHYLTLLVALIMIGLMLLQGRVPKQLVVVFVVAISLYFFHAAITGILANVYDRLQARVLPLIILTGFYATLHMYHKWGAQEDS